MKLAQHLEAKDQIEVVRMKFGDEQSTLLDRFERLSFEVQLNQAIMGRSLSEPSIARYQAPVVGLARPPLVPLPQVQRGRRRLGFHKVMKKLLKPILCRTGGGGCGGRREVPDPKNPRYWKAFSRSLRV